MQENDWLQAAIQAHQHDELEVAETIYLSGLQSHPDNVPALDLLAILYAQTGRYQDASEQLTYALTLEPDNSQLMLHLAQVSRHLNDEGTAKLWLRKALNQKPGYMPAAIQLGQLIEQSGDFAAARLVYQAAYQENPEDPELMHYSALNYLKDRQLSLASDLWESIAERYPHHFESQFYLGTIAYEQNELSKAVVHFENALKLNPAHPETCSNLGAVYLKLERQVDAIHYFNKAIALDPGHLFARTNLGAILLIQGNTDAATQQYYELLAVIPDDFTAHYNLGSIFMEQQKWEIAQGHLQTAVAIEPESFAAVSNLGHVLLKQQRRDAAIDCYRKAYELHPHDPYIAYLVQSLTGEGRPDRAPVEYIQTLFDHYAYYFERDVLDKLQYRVPDLFQAILSETLIDAHELVVIDLGCGTGLCGHFLKPYSSELIGIDLSQKMLDRAREKACYSDLIHADMLIGLTQLSEKIDLVVAADSLVYIGNLEALFTAVKQQLKPGGQFIFSVEIQEQADDYQLQTSGRFSHRSGYLYQLLTHIGFTLRVRQSAILRSQGGESVHGAIYVLESIGAANQK